MESYYHCGITRLRISRHVRRYFTPRLAVSAGSDTSSEHPTMPKFQKKYYVVKVGRGGPNIYNTWEEVRWRLFGRNFAGG